MASFALHASSALSVKRCCLFWLLVASLKTVLGALEPCLQPDVATLPFCNFRLAATDRAKDLVSRLETSEKISQLMDDAPAIERLYIDPYNWWTESLHGILSYCTKDGRCATSYPMPIGIGATFNLGLVKKMASQVSSEGRRFYIEDAGGFRRDADNASRILDRHVVGLDYWAPNINIFRDPRWGRGMETPGEDPYLNGQYAVAYIKGMQEGHDERYLKTISTLKHFAGYSLENWKSYNRVSFDANITNQDLVQTYLPAFEAGIKEGKAGSVMCSYNSVNGVPSCANKFLLQEILRDQWNWNGYVVSDCGAIGYVYRPHKYMPSPATAVSASLKAGTDLNCGNYYNHLKEAIQMGLVSEEDLDRALVRLFHARIRLGMFDPWDRQPYMQYPPETIGAPEHAETALQVAHESLVLLKNDAGVLPLNVSAIKRIAILGPHYMATSAMCGSYHGTLPPIESPFDAIKTALPSVNVVGMKGCEIDSQNKTDFETAAEVANAADVAILFMGISTGIEQEGKDRSDIGLPGVQESFIERIAMVQQKTILVLFNGGAVDVSAAKANENVVAMIEAFYPGMKGGKAVVDVLLGKYNPSGRLPYTIHKKEFTEQISMADMSMTDYPGRTYRYFSGEVVYPFGHGESYTTFSYLPEEMNTNSDDPSHRRHYRVKVTNTGSVSGDTSVLVFMSFHGIKGSYTCPQSQLVGFQKVKNLAPGESKLVVFVTSPSRMKCYDRTEQQLGIPNGLYSVRIANVDIMFHHVERSSEEVKYQ